MAQTRAMWAFLSQISKWVGIICLGFALIEKVLDDRLLPFKLRDSIGSQNPVSQSAQVFARMIRSNACRGPDGVYDFAPYTGASRVRQVIYYPKLESGQAGPVAGGTCASNMRECWEKGFVGVPETRPVDDIAWRKKFLKHMETTTGPDKMNIVYARSFTLSNPGSGFFGGEGPFGGSVDFFGGSNDEQHPKTVDLRKEWHGMVKQILSSPITTGFDKMDVSSIENTKTSSTEVTSSTGATHQRKLLAKDEDSELPAFSTERKLPNSEKKAPVIPDEDTMMALFEMMNELNDIVEKLRISFIINSGAAIGYYRHGTYRDTEDIDLVMRIEDTPRLRAELERRRNDPTSILTWTCKALGEDYSYGSSARLDGAMIKIHHKRNVHAADTRGAGSLRLDESVAIQIFESLPVDRGVPILSVIDDWFWVPPSDAWANGNSNVGKDYFDRFWKGKFVASNVWSSRLFLPSTHLRSFRAGNMEWGTARSAFGNVDSDTPPSSNDAASASSIAGIPLVTRIAEPAVITFEQSNWRNCCRGSKQGTEQAHSGRDIRCKTYAQASGQKMPYLLSANVALGTLFRHVVCGTLVSARSYESRGETLLDLPCARQLRDFLQKSLLQDGFIGIDLAKDSQMRRKVSKQLNRVVAHLHWKVDPHSRTIREFSIDTSFFIDSDTGEIALIPGLSDDDRITLATIEDSDGSGYDESLYYPEYVGEFRPDPAETRLPRDPSISFTDIDNPQVRHVTTLYTSRTKGLPLEHPGLYRAVPFWDDSKQSYHERKTIDIVHPSNWTKSLLAKHAGGYPPDAFTSTTLPNSERVDGFAQDPQGNWNYCRWRACTEFIGTVRWPAWARGDVGFAHRRALLWTTLLSILFMCLCRRYGASGGVRSYKNLSTAGERKVDATDPVVVGSQNDIELSNIHGANLDAAESSDNVENTPHGAADTEETMVSCRSLCISLWKASYSFIPAKLRVLHLISCGCVGIFFSFYVIAKLSWFATVT